MCTGTCWYYNILSIIYFCYLFTVYVDVCCLRASVQIALIWSEEEQFCTLVMQNVGCNILYGLIFLRLGSAFPKAFWESLLREYALVIPISKIGTTKTTISLPGVLPAS